MQYADFVVFPELFTTGYNLRAEYAETEAGPVAKALSEFARQQGSNVIGGSVIESKDGRLYNTAYVFGRDGSLVGRYSKKNLFRPLGEHEFFSSGLERRNNSGIFTLDGMKIGVMICYDLRFSDILLDMKHNCCSLIFCPMEWPEARIEVRESFAKARAAESHAYLVAANPTGCYAKEEKSVLAGRSSVAGPSGESVFMAGTAAGFYVVEVDLADIARVKEFFQAGAK